MAKKCQVITLNKDWWKNPRPSTDANRLLISRRKKLPNEPFMTVKEVAKRLNVGIWGVYGFISRGELECQQIGRRKRISKEALEDFLMKQNLKRGI